MLNLLVQIFDRTPERMLIDPTITIGALTRQIASSFGLDSPDHAGLNPYVLKIGERILTPGMTPEQLGIANGALICLQLPFSEFEKTAEKKWNRNLATIGNGNIKSAVPASTSANVGRYLQSLSIALPPFTIYYSPEILQSEATQHSHEVAAVPLLLPSAKSELKPLGPERRTPEPSRTTVSESAPPEPAAPASRAPTSDPMQPEPGLPEFGMPPQPPEPKSVGAKAGSHRSGALISIRLERDRKLSFVVNDVHSRLSRSIELRGTSLIDLSIDVRDAFRQEIKEYGIGLFIEIFDSYNELAKSFYHSGREYPNKSTICFATDREDMGIPFETLIDNYEPVAISHPLIRQLTGSYRHGNLPFDTYVSQLDGPLKVLLIASDTLGDGCDNEILELKLLFEAAGATVTILDTAAASLAAVRRQLESRPYDIVHFSGQGRYVPSRPEDGGLVIFESGKDPGEMPVINLRELGTCIRTPPQLFFANVSNSATIADAEKLRNNDYLGILDALVHRGIPTVIGHRWPVTRRAGHRFAQKFYSALLGREQFVPEYALLEARQSIYRQHNEDLTWLTSVLVTSVPHRS